MIYKVIKIPPQPIYESLDLDKKCPFCGEGREYTYLNQVGVSRFKKVQFTRGLFSNDIKKYSVEEYTCCTCHAKWEENNRIEPFILEDTIKDN